MAIKYGSMHVDEKYSSTLEPNLFANSIIIPDVTYTDEYEEDGVGGVYVHKLKTTPVEVGTPGRDFQDESAADDLIQILMNNNYQKSKKLYGVQAAAVEFSVGEAHLALATQEVSESRQLSALACLIKEGTTEGDSAEITDPEAAFITTRKEITTAKGTSDIIFCHPDYYAQMLTVAGKKFMPIQNDRVAATGAVGSYLGHVWIECPLLASAEGKYYDHTGALQTVPFTDVQYIVYNHKTLSIIDNLAAMRVVDSTEFVGSKAQVEMNTGFRVTNKALAVVRKASAAA